MRRDRDEWAQELSKLNAKLEKLATRLCEERDAIRDHLPLPHQRPQEEEIRAQAQEQRKIVAQVAELAGVTGIADGGIGPLNFSFMVLRQIGRISVRGLDFPRGGKPRSVRARRYQGRDFQKRESFVKAAHAVRAAKESILALDKRDQAELRRALICDVTFPAPPLVDNMYAQRLVKDVWNQWPDQLLIALSDRTGSNPFTAPTKGKGRRNGAVTNWHLQTFVEKLWEIANIHGGNLYADHKRVDGGTMIKALRLLAPLLPTGFIPNELPVSTIRTVIQNFKASGKRYF